MEVSRKTMCGRAGCPGTVERRELLYDKGPWQVRMSVCYRCPVCGREEIVDLSLTSKQRKVLARRCRKGAWS